MAERKARGASLSVAQRLRKPYVRAVIPEEDGTFRAEILEFPGCIAVGDTAAEALSILENVAESWLESAMALGQSIPEPFEESEYSGKTVVRMPKSIHRKAAYAAEREGTSLNQLIVSSLAYYLGEREAPSQPIGQVVILTGHPYGSVARATTEGFDSQRLLGYSRYARN